MGDWNWTTFLTFIAGAGILSGIINFGLITIRDYWSKRQSTLESAYLSASRLACILEAFTLRCGQVIAEAEADNIQGREPTPLIPSFPVYPSDLDWKALGPDLTEQALALANFHLAVLNEADYAQVYEADSMVMADMCSVLGAEAWKLARDVRRSWKLQENQRYKVEGEWLLQVAMGIEVKRSSFRIIGGDKPLTVQK
ncbi:MAG: hypothetical protein KF735_02865 [Chelatococcus sp.]|uniref:hypothetical protein n=1 Tax=Chelatococcus sp. TaxID=1953771 RepID=UPI0025BD86C6|nr:hypothetical protein [Chelatococcus sp.]MBX3536556.1 hypothetical protein [Chelatococcus sp.]